MTGGYPAPPRPEEISPPPGSRGSPSPNNPGTPLMTRDLAPERPGATLLQIYRGGRAVGWTRRALPAASARPAVLRPIVSVPSRWRRPRRAPPPAPRSRSPSLLARTRSPALGLGSPKIAVARAPGSPAAASGRGGARSGARDGAGPCLPSRGRMTREVRWVLGWTDGLWACGCNEGSLGERMAQPTVPFFQGPRGFPGCGFFRANIETVCSKLGISSP